MSRPTWVIKDIEDAMAQGTITIRHTTDDDDFEIEYCLIDKGVLESALNCVCRENRIQERERIFKTNQRLIREKGEIWEGLMNAKQALRGAAKRIEDLEDFNRRAAADIKAYNMVIDGMIRGESPCKWCEDYDACKDRSHGCDNWMLKFDHGQKGALDEEGGEQDAGH